MVYRYDINLLKLALILHISTYSKNKEVGIQSLRDANKILTHTYNGNQALAGDLIVNNGFQKSYRVIASKLQRDHTVTRQKLLQHCSSYGIIAQETTRTLNQLLQEGYLEIKNLKGKSVNLITTNGKEKYHWIA